MATSYNRKDEIDLVWDDNKDYIRTQVRLAVNKLKRRLENEALAQASADYQEGLANGELRELGPSLESIQKLVAETASRLILESGV